MSFFEVIGQERRSRKSGKHNEIGHNSSTTPEIRHHEPKSQSAWNYSLIYEPNTKPSEKIEIHTATSENPLFESPNKPKLISITPNQWIFENNIRFDVELFQNFPPNTRNEMSVTNAKFIATNPVYSLLSIQENRMILQAVDREDIKLIRPATTRERAAETEGIPQEKRVELRSSILKKTKFEEKNAHEEKMVELEEAGAFDIDAISDEEHFIQHEGLSKPHDVVEFEYGGDVVDE